MQRFKKHVMRAGNVDSQAQPVVFGRRYGFVRGHIAADPRTGKFVYGANGTLTQAARWRVAAMREIRMARIWYEGHYDLTTKGKYRFYLAKSNSQNLMDSARRGGCRLP